MTHVEARANALHAIMDLLETTERLTVRTHHAVLLVEAAGLPTPGSATVLAGIGEHLELAVVQLGGERDAVAKAYVKALRDQRSAPTHGMDGTHGL